MRKFYRYVGPAEIGSRVAGHPAGQEIASMGDLVPWVRDTSQQPDRSGLIAATFVIDADGRLRIADRRSEHIACAGGGLVLSAGEMFFRIEGELVEVVEVSNQSTGFCPEPESWPAVAAALEQVGVPHPGRFTTEIVFRRCPQCGERNIVKDKWFVCGVCGSELPKEWNF
ncbi:MAG: hypothetical protein C0467_30855 [Planctomycetaceae bacterium]|nr:hypothetical protein [Planctomycetaceae bacterium]